MKLKEKLNSLCNKDYVRQAKLTGQEQDKWKETLKEALESSIKESIVQLIRSWNVQQDLAIMMVDIILPSRLLLFLLWIYHQMNFNLNLYILKKKKNIMMTQNLSKKHAILNLHILPKNIKKIIMRTKLTLMICKKNLKQIMRLRLLSIR